MLTSIKVLQGTLTPTRPSHMLDIQRRITRYTTEILVPQVDLIISEYQPGLLCCDVGVVRDPRFSPELDAE